VDLLACYTTVRRTAALLTTLQLQAAPGGGDQFAAFTALHDQEGRRTVPPNKYSSYWRLGRGAYRVRLRDPAGAGDGPTVTRSDVDFDVADQAGVLASVAAFARHDVSAHSVR